MNVNRFLKTVITIVVGLFLLLPQASLTSCSSERSANVRKAQKEKARKDKEARKQYEQAVKRHMDKQSKTTKAMMKETKNNTPKNTPLKPSSGEKCK